MQQTEAKTRTKIQAAQPTSSNQVAVVRNLRRRKSSSPAVVRMRHRKRNLACHKTTVERRSHTTDLVGKLKPLIRNLRRAQVGRRRRLICSHRGRAGRVQQMETKSWRRGRLVMRRDLGRGLRLKVMTLYRILRTTGSLECLCLDLAIGFPRLDCLSVWNRISQRAIRLSLILVATAMERFPVKQIWRPEIMAGVLSVRDLHFVPRHPLPLCPL